MAAKFITFEGGEGSGKSTQVQRLAKSLRQQKFAVVVTREPGGSAFAEQVRKLILDPSTPRHAALAEALLFYAARADHLAATIRPALANGQWVICDRFSDSTRAYQGYAGDVPGETLLALEAIVTGMTKPDLTIVLDIPAALGLARASARRTLLDPEADGFERRDLNYHQRLRDGFLAIAAAEPERCAVIDGTKDEETVAREIEAAVEARLIAGAT